MNTITHALDTRETAVVNTPPADKIIQINAGSAYTVPKWANTIKVTAGIAWLSYDGIDIILPAGETLTITDPSTPLILSPLEAKPVMLRVMA